MEESMEIRFPFPPYIMRELATTGKFEGVFEGEEISVYLEAPIQGEQLKVLNALLDLYE